MVDYIEDRTLGHFSTDDKDRPRPIVEKIQKLDLKKGDVLVITLSDMTDTNLPSYYTSRIQEKQCKAVKKAVKTIFNDKVQILFVPSTMDLSVIRLEEWFV